MVFALESNRAKQRHRAPAVHQILGIHILQDRDRDPLALHIRDELYAESAGNISVTRFSIVRDGEGHELRTVTRLTHRTGIVNTSTLSRNQVRDASIGRLDTNSTSLRSSNSAWARDAARFDIHADQCAAPSSSARAGSWANACQSSAAVQHPVQQAVSAALSPSWRNEAGADRCNSEKVRLPSQEPAGSPAKVRARETHICLLPVIWLACGYRSFGTGSAVYTGTKGCQLTGSGEQWALQDVAGDEALPRLRQTVDYWNSTGEPAGGGANSTPKLSRNAFW